MEIKLINKEISSLNEVINVLEEQKTGTHWAKETNSWAINRAKEFSQINNGAWFKGLLPKEYLKNILLPKHAHDDKNGKAPFIIPEDTPVSRIGNIYRKRNRRNISDCLNLIDYLKEQIRKEGFIDAIVLGIKDNQLYHIDGLHRMVSLISLVDEGMIYKPIPVYLTQSRSK